MRSKPLHRAEIRLDLLVPAAVLALVGGVLWLALRGSWPARTTSSQPLKIRLVGVQPDGSDDLYDAQGRRIGTRFYTGEHDGRWGAGMMRRAFIFETQETNTSLFNARLELRASGRPISSTEVTVHRLPDGRSELVGAATFSASHYGSFALFGGKRPVTHVDLHLAYMLGTGASLLARFTGPFAVGQTLTQARRCTLTVTNETVDADSISARFRLTVEGRQIRVGLSPVLAMDREGRRHLLLTDRWAGSSQGTTLEFSTPGVSLTNVAAIEVEIPQETLFRDVRVQYPERPPRQWPAYYDPVVARLKLEVPPAKLVGRAFRSPDEAVRVIDVVRGPMVQRAVDAIVHAPRDWKFESLAPESREAVRRAARRWSGLAAVRLQGVRLGLHGQWPEFIEPALGLLEEGTGYSSQQVASALRKLAPALSEAQVRRLAGCVPRSRDAYVTRTLANCLRDHRSPTAVGELLELLRSPDPWLWAHAAHSLASLARDAQYTGDVAFAEDRVFQRRWVQLTGATSVQARGRSLVVPPELVAEARLELPQLMTVELRQRDSGMFQEIFQQVARQVDRPAATALIVRHLRDYPKPAGDSYITARLIRQLNEWHDQDFGGLGPKPGNRREEKLKAEDWKAIIDQIVEWHQPRPAAKDAASGAADPPPPAPEY